MSAGLTAWLTWLSVQGTGCVWLGQYRGGRPWGLSWQAVLGQAWLVGGLDSQGQMTGQLAFIYPDLKTAIVGEFSRGKLLSGFQSRVVGLSRRSGLVVPLFERISQSEFR